MVDRYPPLEGVGGGETDKYIHAILPPFLRTGWAYDHLSVQNIIELNLCFNIEDNQYIFLYFLYEMGG
ncbi:hypothetical protein [Olivibacter sitiensis]|uniref:hypothetical protein n=1 Tax=Olivibacter sitiensis TaxID=376470 RepID=UPI0004847105|nr:hypothetical protein [Olivibacter sitiensis]